MILGTAELEKRLARGDKPTGPDDLVIRPAPDADLMRGNTASIDLHLGCWFATMRESRVPILHLDDDKERVTRKAALSARQIEVLDDELAVSLGPHEANIAKTYYVPFGRPFVLHPNHFVLGVTLEWIRIPHDLAGYVIGRSGWGRRGLIIATAIGVHPHFVGCLTLELTNVGEVPVAIKPGAGICQLFLHSVQSGGGTSAVSQFASSRRPLVGRVRMDTLGQKVSAT